jgi:DnaK suppressor protein
MTTPELEALRTSILAKIAEAEASTIFLADATQPIEPSNALGRLTRMEAISEKSVNEAVHSRVKTRLEGLRNALNRIDQGSYGFCVRCKREIPFGRLDAMPEALICVPCAERKKL